MKISELKGKHDHALTSWLKVIIFSLLMIAPLFASISQWVYVTCNKNAKDSYSNSIIENQVLITNGSQFQVGATVQFNYVEQTGTATYTNEFAFSKINLDLATLYGTQYNRNYNYDRISARSDGYLYISDSSVSGSQINKRIWGTTVNNFAITFVSVNSNSLTVGNGSAYIYQYQYKIESLDNAFYYGVEKMTQSDLFNWTQDTTLYSGIKTMTDNLEIQTPAIAILLTYWFILTIIYVIIDIVLKGFTTLTHLIMGAKN